MSGWIMIAMGQGAMALGAWLLSRHFGWEPAVAALLLLEGAVGAVYGMVSVNDEPEPWHGGALNRDESEP